MSFTLPEMVAIPGGRTWIGASPNDKFAHQNEPPGQWVDITSPFEIGKFPVTIGEWHKYEPGRFVDHDPGLPAHGISWREAAAYLAWLRESTQDNSWDLPTAVAWECAARAGTNSIFPEGDTLDPGKANFHFNESLEKVGCGSLSRVTHFPPNAFGVHDLLGNVGEWTSTAGSKADHYLIKGGAWDYLPRLLRCSSFDSQPSGCRRDNLGLRLARRVV